MVIKKCKIHATSPITCFTVPIVGTTELNLTTDEIYKCLCAKAEVMEILANGKAINLDFSNYNRDNSIIGEPVEEVKEEIVEVTPEPPVEEVVENNVTFEEDAVVEVAETEVVEITVEDTVEVEDVAETVATGEVEEEVKEPAETVKEFKVESRNNNYNKNKKNNKKK
jgi:hypothetical protein